MGKKTFDADPNDSMNESRAEKRERKKREKQEKRLAKKRSKLEGELPEANGYAPEEGYTPEANGYAPEEGYTPEANGYPPEEGYPPETNGYAPEINGYTPDANSYPVENGYSWDGASYPQEEHGEEGYGPEGGVPENYGPEGYVPETNEPMNYDPEGYDPENYGPENFALEGYGRENYGPEDYGPENYVQETSGPMNYSPEGYGPEIYGPETNGPMNYGPEGYGPETYGPDGLGPEYYVPDGYGPEVHSAPEEDVYWQEGDGGEPHRLGPAPKPRKKRRKRIWRVLGRTAIVLMSLLFITILGFGIFYLVCAAKAPKLDLLDVQPQYYRSTVLDVEGNVALTLSGQESNRVYVRLSEIPKNLQQAFVAIEDERFYEHHGVDFKGVIRAIVKGITSGGNFTQGASTITQQLIKNNVLTGWTEEKTLFDKIERKIQEQSMAWSLERKVDKNWILENYLNTINLGGGNWGVETAAKYYFDKDVSDLTLSECAVLAGITKNPTTYNPLTHPEENEGRKKLVLAKMLTLGMITQEEHDAANADPVYQRIAAVSSTGHKQQIMSYFEDALVNEIINDLQEQLGMTEAEAWDKLYRGGLTIESTESNRIQRICEDIAMRDDLLPENAQISLVVLDNATGQVRAMVGGRGTKEGSLLYNRATSALRQPGSTIKIIGEYAAGLEDGKFTLGTAIDDAPATYSNGTSLVNSDGRYLGKTTVHEAIVRSGNIVALKCFQEEGMENVVSRLRKFGISTLTDEDMVEALALGGTHGGVTNMEMTAAYNALSRGGQYRTPIYYTRILSADGQTILEKEQEVHQAVSANTASLLTAAMQDVVESGTGVEARLTDMPAAGKSGTTSNVRDAWFIGYTPYLTCGVWGGNDDNSGQTDSGYVKVIWREVMQNAHAGLAERAFAENTGLEKVSICRKCGKLAVPGLCDDTVQGNMTTEEFYAPGTQPTEICDCHVKVEICSYSHQKVAVREEDEKVWSFFGGWRTNGKKGDVLCPMTYFRVYLKEATEGTEDKIYVVPYSYGEDGKPCAIHQITATPTPTMTPTPTPRPTGGSSFWDWFWGRSDDDEEEVSTTSPSDTGNTANGGQGSTFGDGTTGGNTTNGGQGGTSGTGTTGGNGPWGGQTTNDTANGGQGSVFGGGTTGGNTTNGGQGGTSGNGTTGGNGPWGGQATNDTANDDQEDDDFHWPEDDTAREEQAEEPEERDFWAEFWGT